MWLGPFLPIHSSSARRRGSARCFQQTIDMSGDNFVSAGCLPVEFTLPEVTHVALAVDHVDGGPPVVAPCGPGLLVVVDGDRKVKFSLGGLVLQLRDVSLDLGFGGVDSDNHNVSGGELLRPLPVPGIVADAVDSSKGVKMQDDDLSTQRGHGQRLGVEPLHAGGELWRTVPQSPSES